MSFRRVGRGLAGLLLEHVDDDAGRLSVVQAVWPSVVGPDLDARSRPVRLGDRILTVSVDDERWLPVVRELEAALRHRLDEAFGCRIVDSFEWRGPGDDEQPRRQPRVTANG
jgi:hypothetical protein